MNNEELDRFIREMLADKDLTGVDDEVRDQLVADMKAQLLDLIDRAVVDALPDSKAGEFGDLLDKPDTTDEQLREFVKNAGVDVERVTIDTMIRFRNLYVTPQAEREP